MERDKIELSSLGHTWILDLDGTIVKHNGYKIDGFDTFLLGAKDFLDSIPEEDMLILLTSRKRIYKDITEKFLKENNIKYDYLIFEAPYGERILINDDKPSGLKMCYSLSCVRDSNCNLTIDINGNL